MAFARRILSLLFLDPRIRASIYFRTKSGQDLLAMAFDNGGVATGPMCSTFILSMSVAIAAQIEGRDPIIDGFGVVAMIALTPILSTLVLGYIYKRKDEKDRIEKERLQKLGKANERSCSIESSHDCDDR